MSQKPGKRKLAPDSKWNVFSKPVHRNRPRADIISFDEDSRKEFLSGFRKRKNQRREMAKTQASKIVQDQRREEKQQRREEIAGYVTKLIHAKDAADEGGEAFLMDQVEDDGRMESKSKRSRSDSDSEDGDDEPKVYETENLKITAIVEDGDAAEPEEEDPYADMPALERADPPKKGQSKKGPSKGGNNRFSSSSGGDRPRSRGGFEEVPQGHPRHPWQRKKHLGGGGGSGGFNKKRKLN